MKKIDNDAVHSPSRTCGIIMPIGEIDGCSQHHWQDVLEILSDAIEASGYESNIVSNADEVSFINKRIVQNLYQNPIVVCDVSGKNPNVMFELGIRLAFDKPTILVKDDKTNYSFDIAGIEHLPYPRDLRFSKIVDFKKNLQEKIKATAAAAESNEGYTTFLKHFGEFKVPKLDSREVSGQEFMLDELKAMRQSIAELSRFTRPKPAPPHSDLCLRGKKASEVEKITNHISLHPDVLSAKSHRLGEDHYHVRFATRSPGRARPLKELFRETFGLDHLESEQAKLV